MEKLQINIPKGFMIDEAKSDLANGIVEFKEIKIFDYKTIKTFENACEKLGISTELPFSFHAKSEYEKSIIADYKLKIIYKAINNGWVADYSDSNQAKYYPWFKFQQTRGASGGFGFSYYFCSYGHSNADVGSCLCTDSKEKAEYIAKQFEDLYNDWLL